MYFMRNPLHGYFGQLRLFKREGGSHSPAEKSGRRKHERGNGKKDCRQQGQRGYEKKALIRKNRYKNSPLHLRVAVVHWQNTTSFSHMYVETARSRSWQAAWDWMCVGDSCVYLYLMPCDVSASMSIL